MCFSWYSGLSSALVWRSGWVKFVMLFANLRLHMRGVRAARRERRGAHVEMQLLRPELARSGEIRSDTSWLSQRTGRFDRAGHHWHPRLSCLKTPERSQIIKSTQYEFALNLGQRCMICCLSNPFALSQGPIWKGNLMLLTKMTELQFMLGPAAH